MIDYYRPERLVKNGITAFKVKVTSKSKHKLGIVMHHHELECHAKRFVFYFQGQGHSKGSYDQNMTVSTISS